MTQRSSSYVEGSNLYLIMITNDRPSQNTSAQAVRPVLMQALRGAEGLQWNRVAVAYMDRLIAGNLEPVSVMRAQQRTCLAPH